MQILPQWFPLPFSYVAWSPFPSLVLTHFRPFSQILAYDNILVFSSCHSLWSLSLWIKTHRAMEVWGFAGTGDFPPTTPPLSVPQKLWVGTNAVWKFSHFSVTRLWIFLNVLYYYCYCGFLFWNKNSECTLWHHRLGFVLFLSFL